MGAAACTADLKELRNSLGRGEWSGNSGKKGKKLVQGSVWERVFWFLFLCSELIVL